LFEKYNYGCNIIFIVLWTERYFDLMNFSVEYMAVADWYLIKCSSLSWSSWPPLLWSITGTYLSYNSNKFIRLLTLVGLSGVRALTCWLGATATGWRMIPSGKLSFVRTWVWWMSASWTQKGWDRFGWRPPKLDVGGPCSPFSYTLQFVLQQGKPRKPSSSVADKCWTLAEANLNNI
jgi:hypothetical protein